MSIEVQKELKQLEGMRKSLDKMLEDLDQTPQLKEASNVLLTALDDRIMELKATLYDNSL